MVKFSNPISQFTDEFVELGKDTGKKFVRDVVKGVPKTAKSQVVGNPQQPQQQDGANDKLSPVTGKPIPSKAVLTQLTQATSQLQMAKLQQVRKELEESRLKVSQDKSLAGKEGAGPEIPVEKPKKPVDVDQMLKNSQSTGEARGGAG